MNPLIWIIDEEWSEYKIEENILKSQFPMCIIKHSRNNYQEDLDKFGKYADAILCQVYVDMPKETIDCLQNCKIIAVYGGGYDRVDVDYAKSRNITVTFVPNYCVEDVSDYVISAIYFFNKNLPYYMEVANAGPWGAQAVKQLGKRIQSSTLFIIGFGRIGRVVAEKAKRMQMDILIYDPIADEDIETKFGIKKVSLEYGLRNADYVTLHTNFYEGVRSLISMNEFQMMKETAYIINTSRGKVINEKDLISAVENKIIAGAMLDVIADEPPVGNESIFNCTNIFVTPHVSYLSIESLSVLKERAANNVITILQGKKSEDSVY